jgi:hypothetical protein
MQAWAVGSIRSKRAAGSISVKEHFDGRVWLWASGRKARAKQNKICILKHRKGILWKGF